MHKLIWELEGCGKDIAVAGSNRMGYCVEGGGAKGVDQGEVQEMNDKARYRTQ